MRKRELFLITSLIAIISFLIIFYFNVVEVAEQSSLIIDRVGQGPPMPIPINYRMWLSPLLLIVAVIPISYYFISQRLESKLEKNMKVMLKLVGRNNIKEKNTKEIINKDAILKFLNFNERKVLEKLIKKKGEVLQSEISNMDGMNKLKTHRAIKNLEMKGVITTENKGKTKQIILSKDIKNILLK